jgi:predicted GNAT family acetyltransferase
MFSQPGSRRPPDGPVAVTIGSVPDLVLDIHGRAMADEPEIQVSDKRNRHRYEAYVGDHLAAYATYQEVPDGLIFLHTETEPGYEGQGVASRLARAALDDVRARGLLITARCPFITAYIDRHPEYADLVDRSS